MNEKIKLLADELAAECEKENVDISIIASDKNNAIVRGVNDKESMLMHINMLKREFSEQTGVPIELVDMLSSLANNFQKEEGE